MAENMLKCAMCPFATVNERVLTNHYVRNHRFDDRFYVMCNVENCGATYKRWKSYKMHVYRKHNANAEALFEDNGNAHDDEQNADEEMPYNEPVDDADPWEDAQLEAVKFVLNIRDSCKTSDVSRQKVMERTLQLMESYMSIFLRKMKRQADPNTRMVSVDTIQTVLTETLPTKELFSKVDSKSKLDSFLVENFKMIIPQEVILGRALKWKRKPTPDLIEEERKGYTIPLLEGLRRLLVNEEVRHCVENPKYSGETMKTVLDGAYYKTHPFFSDNLNSLGIILYYGIEIVNPLGSHTHKLGMFYWSLANIYPELRSSFNSVNLLAIAKYCDLKKFGIQKILEQFVEEINILQTEGVSIMVNGVLKTFKGSLLFVSADTPAAALLGGFKQSVSANKPCRRCLTSQEQWKSLFSERECNLRTMETHLNNLEAICTPHLQIAAKQFWQKLYGVNDRSPLLEINGFDITKCLVQDPMHILSEGCLEVETRLFLKWCVNEGVFSLADFNEKVSLFDFRHLSKNKPSNILPIHLNNNLRQSAAQMVCLSYVLPFIVVDLVEDDIEDTATYERLLCHNLLLQVANICFAFEVDSEDASFLENLIEMFLQKFLRLYPDTIVPKFHFLLHFPNQIIQFGPLRQQWCMRFEAVHAWFKSLARVRRSVKNIPWSLSYRHESFRCMQLYCAPGTQSKCFLYGGDLISEGSNVPLHELPEPDQGLLHPLLINHDLNELILLCTRKAVVHGTKYLQGSLVLLSCEESDLPVFGQISNIYCYDGKVHFIILPYETVQFSQSRNAYNIRTNADARACAIAINDLIYPHELSVFYSKGLKYVVLFNHARTELIEG